MQIKKLEFNEYRKMNAPKNENTSLKGVLVDNYNKKQQNSCCLLDEPAYSEFVLDEADKALPKNEENAFDYKKATKPLAVASIVTLGVISAISICMKRYSSHIASKADFVRPGDLARNINIVEEPHFAMYRALREPNAKNVVGLIAVCLMSAVTMCAKNFTDGISEIWVKKQNFDIEQDFQKDMIEVETKSFSGKLKAVNELLINTKNHFKEVLYNKNQPVQEKNLSFQGNNKETNKTKDKKNNILYAISAIVGVITLAYGVFKNYQKTIKNLDIFVQKYEDSAIKARIENALKINNKEEAIKELTGILKVINAKDETINKTLNKVNGITEEEVKNATKDVKSSQIYAAAPEALGGISEKIQYYCYMNEDRGHLYNWILNPENKFNKYLFLSFSLLSALGYSAKVCADAIKSVAVEKETKKNELNLRKNLVQIEIDNFKSKKYSAINPMKDTFDLRAKNGESKEKLEEYALNVLNEIKNGPPYIYS